MGEFHSLVGRTCVCLDCKHTLCKYSQFNTHKTKANKSNNSIAAHYLTSEHIDSISELDGSTSTHHLPISRTLQRCLHVAIFFFFLLLVFGGVTQKPEIRLCSQATFSPAVFFHLDLARGCT